MNDQSHHEDDAFDQFEEELRQFAPRDVAANFKERLRTAIETEPTGSSQPSSRHPFSSHRVVVWTLSIAIAAALVVGAFFAIGGLEPDKGEPRLGGTTETNRGSNEVIPVDASGVQSNSRPTILAYRSAFASSNQELDELLDQHAHALFTPSNVSMDPLPMN